MPYRVPSTENPEFCFPVVAADGSAGFSSAYDSHFRMSRAVGHVDGQWRNYIEFDLNNLPGIAGTNAGAYPALRKVFAMHWGKLLFSYDHQAPVSNVAALPEDRRSRVRAYLFFPTVELRYSERSRGVTGTRNGEQVDVTMLHHPASLGSLNENFCMNHVTQYWNLDKDSTKVIIADYISGILAGTGGWREDFLNQSNPISAAVWRRTHSSLGRRPSKLNGLIAGDSPRMTALQFVEACLFNDSTLLANLRSETGGTGILVPPGQCIGLMANREGNSSAATGPAKLFLSMWTARASEGRSRLGPFPLNPVYFIHSFMRQPAKVSYKNDLSAANHYGLPLLSVTPFDHLSSSPGAGQKAAIHPVLWELSRIGSFRFAERGAEGTIAVRDIPPPLFIESSAAFTPPFTSTVNPGEGSNILGIDSRLTAFHPHVRLDQSRTSIISRGSRYEWRVDERGFILLRTSGAPEKDDWYFYFGIEGNNSLLEIFRIWRDHGILINKYASAFQVPCELIIALLARESGGNPKACALEPWYPIIRSASGNIYTETSRRALIEASLEAWEHDKNTYISNETFRNTKNSELIGYRFFLALNRTPQRTGGLKVGGRYGLSIPDNLDTEISLRENVLLPGFTWSHLLQLLDELGPQNRSLGSGNMGSGIDMRISPGLSQFLVGVFDDKIFAGDRAAATRDLNQAAFPDGSRSDFFVQDGVDISRITDANRSQALSLRFKWMCVPENMIATTAYAVKRYMQRLLALYTLSDPDCWFLNPRDPVYILGQHGGTGDLAYFSAGEPFGFITTAGAAASERSAERRKWHGTLDGYNAAVFLFEQHDLLSAYGLPEPTVRYHQTT